MSRKLNLNNDKSPGEESQQVNIYKIMIGITLLISVISLSISGSTDLASRIFIIGIIGVIILPIIKGVLLQISSSKDFLILETEIKNNPIINFQKREELRRLKGLNCKPDGSRLTYKFVDSKKIEIEKDTTIIFKELVDKFWEKILDLKSENTFLVNIFENDGQICFAYKGGCTFYGNGKTVDGWYVVFIHIENRGASIEWGLNTAFCCKEKNGWVHEPPHSDIFESIIKKIIDSAYSEIVKREYFNMNDINVKAGKIEKKKILEVEIIGKNFENT